MWMCLMLQSKYHKNNIWPATLHDERVNETLSMFTFVLGLGRLPHLFGVELNPIHTSTNNTFPTPTPSPSITTIN